MTPSTSLRRSGRATRRGVAAVVAAVLAAAAAWQIGAALYIPAKAMLAQHLLHRAWTRTLAGARDVRPWPWADTSAVARLRVPAHGADLIVLAGAMGRSLAFGPGHLDGTPRPGEPGNSIIGGHRDTSLRFLEHVAPGERVTIETPAGATVAYRVTGSAIVDSRRPWSPPESDAPMLTLVTCWPFDAPGSGGPLRYLVFAEAE